jgi:hypothetical protein
MYTDTTAATGQSRSPTRLVQNPIRLLTLSSALSPDGVYEKSQNVEHHMQLSLNRDCVKL